MGRKACRPPKEGLNRGSWTAMEDDILVSYIKKHGEGKWGCLPRKAGLKRCGKSCRLRWLNYLRPGIKRGNISSDEEELIIRLHRLLGNRWSLIAGRLPGRTDNEIKNYWNTTLGKKVAKTISGPPKGGNATGAVSGAAPDESSAPPQWSPDANPVRTKALRCTASRLPVVRHHHTCAAALGADHVRAGVEQTAAAAAVVEVEVEAQAQQDYPPPPEDELSVGVDVDFDMGELGSLSPWRGDVGGGAGLGAQFDLEALMLGPGGDGDLHEFAWF
ncbi:hypothetical protein BS78_01G326200 [Paspalum vaginatum]|nr:hypothetical protein BS78_01G326200 [Paspalum vaginatum]